jgi:DNA-directed RNA polymerase subunit alpha
MISLPSKPKIVEKKAENIALFEVDSLYPGYGVTIGNSIRRVLLSSLNGVAVTKVKITDVNHEFSTIPGIIEDVITIILNLKELRFRLFSDEEQFAKLKIKGETEVRGEHFQLPTQVELVNPEVHIATLTDKNASLEMEIGIEKGTGYSSAEDRQEEKLEVGQMLVDSIFTPVRRANFYVENMRVGKRTDFDRLFIEIETDGTISPEDAFFQSIDVLSKHFSILSSFEEEKEKEIEPKNTKKEKIEDKKAEEKIEKKEDKEDKNTDDVEETLIEDLGISARTVNILKENKIKKIKNILKKKESDIVSLKGMGDKGVEEIKKALKKKKLNFKQEK